MDYIRDLLMARQMVDTFHIGLVFAGYVVAVIGVFISGYMFSKKEPEYGLLFLINSFLIVIVTALLHRQLF